jgi:Zn-dependent peptidase ImmA (M78 family)
MKALAQLLEVTPPMVTYYEAGLQTPTPDVMQRLCNHLGFPAEFLYAAELEPILQESVSFRSRASMTAGVRDAAISAGAIASEILAPVFRDEFRIPALDVPDLSGHPPAEAAKIIRGLWRLGHGPIGNMVHVLEAHGVGVYWLRDDSPCLDAVSFWRDGYPFVVLNLGKSGERGRLDAAHELGHLVLHRHHAELGTKKVEDEATEFGSAFLLPELQFREECPRDLSFPRYFEMKPRWKVSVAAMLVRAHRLGLLSEWIYGRAFREMGSRDWRHNEPNPIPREESTVQDQIYRLLAKRSITPADWCRKTCLPWQDVVELTPTAERLIDVRPTPAPDLRHSIRFRVVDGGLA